MTISVITCTYNAASCLPRTLQSVSAQKYKDVEHIIVDGKSTDGTMDLVKKYKESTPETSPHSIKAISEPDHGLYDAMNKGIQMATGDYLIFLNAGDTFKDKHTLQQVAQAAAASVVKPGVIYGDTDIVDSEGKFICHRRLSPPENLSWKSFKHGMLVCHQAFYANTLIAKETLYNLQYRYSADVDWCIRIMKTAATWRLPIVNAHAILANFLDGGMTTAYHRSSLRERFNVMRRHYGTATTIVMHLWFVLRSIHYRIKNR